MLTIDGVSKSFQGVQALTDVHLRLAAGQVLGLVGENGAGKSTLMNVLGGVVQPDRGTMTFEGRPYAPAAPADATAAGIVFIHQELNLFPNLSIADNLFIDGFPAALGGGWIWRRAHHRQTRELLGLVGLEAAPQTLVEDLAPGERQLVEIARALRDEAKLIIFDEPTTSLTARETERLFALIDRLRAAGTAIIYISHALDDVLHLCDTIVVLRDGEVVDAGPRADFTTDRMIEAMVGRTLEQLFPDYVDTRRPEPVLTVTDVSQPGVVEGISFTLHRGEVLGLFGLMGAGRTELARILFGLDSQACGTVHLHGEPIHDVPPRARIERGLAFVTEDRRGEGLLMDAPVLENVALASLPAFAGPARLLRPQALREAVQERVEALRIKHAAEVRQPARTLSGGNQQKVVLGKWLLTQPEVFLLDEPTRGIDVGAKFEVYRLIRELAAEGAGIVCVSSELEELTGLCDRMLVMYRGEIRAVFEREAFVEERILRAAFGEEAAA